MIEFLDCNRKKLICFLLSEIKAELKKSLVQLLFLIYLPSGEAYQTQCAPFLN